MTNLFLFLILCTEESNAFLPAPKRASICVSPALGRRWEGSENRKLRGRLGLDEKRKGHEGGLGASWPGRFFFCPRRRAALENSLRPHLPPQVCPQGIAQIGCAARTVVRLPAVICQQIIAPQLEDFFPPPLSESLGGPFFLFSPLIHVLRVTRTALFTAP